jgi:hypothetical protein
MLILWSPCLAWWNGFPSVEKCLTLWDIGLWKGHVLLGETISWYCQLKASYRGSIITLLVYHMKVLILYLMSLFFFFLKFWNMIYMSLFHPLWAILWTWFELLLNLFLNNVPVVLLPYSFWMEQEDWHHIFRILSYVHKEDNFIIVVIVCSSCTAFASGNQMAVSFLLQIMQFKCVLCYGKYVYFFSFVFIHGFLVFTQVMFLLWLCW